MISVLFTSDWQASVNNLDRCQAALEQVLEIVRKEKCQYVVHLGDLKEHFNPVDQRVQNFLISAAQQIIAMGSKLLVLRGNHDSITTQDGVPSCMPVLASAGAKVVSDSAEVVLLDKGIGLWMVPYFRDPERQLGAFRGAKDGSYQFKGTRILAFHNEIAGCQKTAYVKGKGLTLNEIGAVQYDFCIGGHIHRPQQSNNVLYVGSPFSCDWGEANEIKRFLLLRIEKNVREVVISIPSKIPGWYDPAVPGYERPANFKGTRFRFSIPVNSDPNKELQQARIRLAKEYPGANLHLVPDFQKFSGPKDAELDTTGSDEQLLTRYLEQTELPEGITVGQLTEYLKQFLPSTNTLGVQPLRFHSAKAQNTLCFEEVELKLDRPGLTLVTGINHDWSDHSNGAGKSSYVSIPFVTMFGKTIKGQTHDGWALQSSNATCTNQLILQLPDNRVLRLERGRRPPLLKVYCDNKEISMGDANATQTLIESLTNSTWEVLTNAVYIGQQEIGTVFGTDKERKELFSRLLGLGRFLDVQTQLRKVLSRRQRAVDEVQEDCRSAAATLNEATTALQEIVTARANAPQANPEAINTLKTEIAKKSAAQKEIEKEAKTVQQGLDANQKEYEKLLDAYSGAEGLVRAIGDQLDKSQTVRVGKECPLCGGKISAKHLEEHHNTLKLEIKEVESKAQHLNALMEENRRERNAQLQKSQRFQSEYRSNDAAIESWKRELTVLQQQNALQEQLKGIELQRQARCEELGWLHNIHTQATYAHLEEFQFIQVCVDTVGRNGLPAYLCSIVAPQLNAAAARYSEIFSEGEIGLQFELAGGELDVHVSNLHGGKTAKDQSVGEMQIAALIAAFAFREVLVPHNILILDEPGEGLDPENAAGFARGLRSIVERFHSVFVISHNPYLLGELEPDYHLVVEKQNGIATVKESV